jgi:hypothetical protein
MTSKVKRISSCRFLEAGFKLEHTNGSDFETQLHLAKHMSASSSSDDSLAYSTMLTGHSFLGLSPLLVKLLDSLARLSQSRTLCKAWLTSEKTWPSSFSLRCDDTPEISQVFVRDIQIKTSISSISKPPNVISDGLIMFLFNGGKM